MHKQLIAAAMREICAADDLDLYEEVASKLADVLRVYRRYGKTTPQLALEAVMATIIDEDV